MSAPTATATEAPGPAKKGKKKLIIIIAAAVLVLAVGGGAAMMLMKKKAADADGEGADDHGPAKAAVSKHDPKAVPVFVPLDPFTVNLADREAERYAQVGITLEITDTHVGDQIKLYMPAIRNHILMAIADRTAAELMGREGKAALAEKVRRETSRALGVEMGEDEAAPDAEDAGDKPAAKKSKKKRKSAPPELPVKAVHFSNFIIQ
jgi:flagellar FliL protein